MRRSNGFRETDLARVKRHGRTKMFKKTHGKAVQAAMAVLVAVGSLAGGVGCDEEALINLATQAVQAELESASEELMDSGSDFGASFGSEGSSWLDAPSFDPDCGC